MGSNSSFLVYFAGPTTLADASRALSRSLNVVEDGDALRVRWRDALQPELVVGFSAEDHVAIEAAEVAEWKGIDAIRGLDRRFEVFVDDLESALDETNTLAEVQMVLQDLTDGYLVLAWNGSVLPPYVSLDGEAPS